MKRLPPFRERTGPRGLVRAAAYQSPEGRIGIRVSVPTASGRDAVLELSLPQARDAIAAIGEALADARSALDLVCECKPHARRSHRSGGSDADV